MANIRPDPSADPSAVHRARRDEGKMTIKNFDRRDGFEIFPRTHLLVINCGANENALSNQDVHAPFGNLSFDLLDLLFSHTRRRVNPYMAVLIFETLHSRFDPGFRTQLLRQQAQLGQVLVDKDPSF